MGRVIFDLLDVACAGRIRRSVTTATTTTGTLEEYTPGSAFVGKETSGPVKYRYGENVTYVTRSGKTLTDADVKTNGPVPCAGRPGTSVFRGALPAE